MGSTSDAITTYAALPVSTKCVMWFKPYFKTRGLLLSSAPPATLDSAAVLKRSFLAALSSGRYFSNNLNKGTAVM